MKVTAEIPADKTKRVADRVRQGNRRSITGSHTASGGLLNRPDTLRRTQLDASDSGQSLVIQRTQNHTIQKRGTACTSRARTQRTEVPLINGSSDVGGAADAESTLRQYALLELQPLHVQYFPIATSVPPHPANGKKQGIACPSRARTQRTL